MTALVPVGSRRLLVLPFLLLLGTMPPAAALEVRLLGLSGVMAENIRGSVGLFDLAERDTVDAYVVDFYLRTVEREVARALAPFGFYAPEVEIAREGAGTIVLTVAPGPPTLVAARTISFSQGGAPWTPDFALPAFPLKPGDRLDHELYERGKGALRNALFDAGYVDAAARTHAVRVDPEARTAAIELTWEVGPRHVFGETIFEGTALAPDVLARFPAHAPGEPFDPRELLELSTRLRDSQYFSRVSVTPDLSRDEPVVPVTVKVEPGEPVSYSLGVLYGTDSGGGIEADVEVRRVNRHGHRARVTADFAQREQRVAGIYEVPSSSEYDSLHRLAASVTEAQTDSFDTRARRLGLSRLHRWGRWRRTDSLQLLDERSEFGTSVTDSRFLLPALAMSRTVQDGDTIPREGMLTRFTLRGAAEALLSETDFLQADVHARYVTSATETLRLILRGSLGATWVDEFEALPASLRFFAGGDRSVRGYDFESLGPRNEAGDVVGGRYLVEASVELERRLFGPWRIAGFVDAGNALESLTGDFDSLAYGAGVGVRYASPVGLIRVDVGFPLDAEVSGPRLHLVVGPDL